MEVVVDVLGLPVPEAVRSLVVPVLAADQIPGQNLLQVQPGLVVGRTAAERRTHRSLEQVL